MSRRPGRPAIGARATPRARLDAATAAALDALVAAWGVSESEAIRRAIRAALDTSTSPT